MGWCWSHGRCTAPGASAGHTSTCWLPSTSSITCIRSPPYHIHQSIIYHLIQLNPLHNYNNIYISIFGDRRHGVAVESRLGDHRSRVRVLSHTLDLLYFGILQINKSLGLSESEEICYTQFGRIVNSGGLMAILCYIRGVRLLNLRDVQRFVTTPHNLWTEWPLN